MSCHVSNRGRWGRINFLKLLGNEIKAKRQGIALKYVDAEYL